MSDFIKSLPPIKLFVRKEFLHDFEKGHGEYEKCMLISYKSIPGLAMTFQVLLENGVLRDKLPISALVTKPCIELPLDFLQIWDCPSYSSSAVCYSFLSNLRCSVYGKDKQWYDGEYKLTIDFHGDSHLDLSLAEEASEHKSMNMVFGDNGHIFLQPNNRIKFYEASFCTKPFPDKPDYKVCSEFYKVENASKWVTEDSNKYLYEFLKTRK